MTHILLTDQQDYFALGKFRRVHDRDSLSRVDQFPIAVGSAAASGQVGDDIPVQREELLLLKRAEPRVEYRAGRASGKQGPLGHLQKRGERVSVTETS